MVRATSSTFNLQLPFVTEFHPTARLPNFEQYRKLLTLQPTVRAVRVEEVGPVFKHLRDIQRNAVNRHVCRTINHCGRICISRNWYGCALIPFVVKLVGESGVDFGLGTIFLRSSSIGSSAIKTDRSMICKCNLSCGFGISCLFGVRKGYDIGGIGFSLHHRFPVQSCQTA